MNEYYLYVIKNTNSRGHINFFFGLPPINKDISTEVKFFHRMSTGGKYPDNTLNIALDPTEKSPLILPQMGRNGAFYSPFPFVGTYHYRVHTILKPSNVGNISLKVSENPAHSTPEVYFSYFEIESSLKLAPYIKGRPGLLNIIGEDFSENDKIIVVIKHKGEICNYCWEPKRIKFCIPVNPGHYSIHIKNPLGNKVEPDQLIIMKPTENIGNENQADLEITEDVVTKSGIGYRRGGGKQKLR